MQSAGKKTNKSSTTSGRMDKNDINLAGQMNLLLFVSLSYKLNDEFTFLTLFSG